MPRSDVLVALQNGEQHPAGVYAASGKVLTIDGKPTSYELVAVMVPLEMLQPFAIAHAQARATPEGATLAARLQAGFPVGPARLQFSTDGIGVALLKPGDGGESRAWRPVVE